MSAGLSVELSGCTDFPVVKVQLGAGDIAPTQRFTAMVAADEPEAGRIAEEILDNGGNAVDAATALGLALSVTLPSSAGLAGEGACLVHAASTKTTEVLDFSDGASAARGLYALHAKYGTRPWAQVVAPAEKLARFGYRVSQIFATDLAADGAVLTADASALTMFMTPQRQMAQAGDRLTQPVLASVLAQLRARGIVAAGDAPRWAVPVAHEEKGLRVYTWAAGDVQHATASGTTGFVVADAKGNAAACTLSMGRPFGTGHLNADGVLQQAPGGKALVSTISMAEKDQTLRLATAGDRLVNTLRCDDSGASCRAVADTRGSGFATTAAPKE